MMIRRFIKTFSSLLDCFLVDQFNLLARSPRFQFYLQNGCDGHHGAAKNEWYTRRQVRQEAEQYNEVERNSE